MDRHIEGIDQDRDSAIPAAGLESRELLGGMQMRVEGQRRRS